MKLSVLLLVAGLTNVMANVYSQNVKVTFRLNGVNVEKVLAAIAEKTDYKMIYDNSRPELNRAVNIVAVDRSVRDILNEVLQSNGLQYEIIDKYIVITSLKTEAGTLQRQKIAGTITDVSTGETLAGVNVTIEGTTLGTVTDASGKYTIDIPSANTILVFSFIGYNSERIDVGGKTTLDVAMIPDITKLDEIVVVGYGSQGKKEISGSVTNVTAKDFNKGASRNAADLLVGRVPGLVITSGSGDVTKNSTIRLRGMSSLTGSSEPFIVVDGIPGIPLSSISPQDIESISVLKDASATAIYGSRSASGVILITTKKGKKDKTTIEYEGYAGIDKVSNIPDLLTAAEWRDYAQKNSINTEGIDLGANTNWFKEIMRVGFTQNHSLSMGGGGKNSLYRGSFSYLDKQGVVKDNDMERYNARLMFNQKALKDKLDLTFIGSFTENNYSPTDTRNFILAYNMIPVVPVKNADGTWFDSQEYDQGNPVRNITYNNQSNKNSQFYGNIKADLEIVNGLVAGLNILKQRESNDFGLYYDAQTERGRNTNGYAKRESWTKDKKLMEVTLNYKKTFGIHNLNILGGYSYEDNNYQKFSAANRYFITNFTGYNDLASGQDLRAGDVLSKANMYKLISFFGRLNYIINDKYILMASLRRDGSSKFGKNNKWGTFPSFSAAWRISQESFMKDLVFLSDLKLRAGYGMSGNQDNIDPYQSIFLTGASGQYYDNGKWLSSYDVIQNANPNLKWEKTAMVNIGIDFGLFKNRVTGTIEFYNKKTTDLLYTYSAATPPNPIATIIANVGSMTNKGIEFAINGDIISKENLRWNVSLNLAHNVNKVTKISNEEYQITYIPTGNVFIRGGSSNYTSRIEVGKPVGTFYGLVCKGVDKTTGEFIIDDMVDGAAGITDADRTHIGSAQPKLTYGLSNTFIYKNWDFNFFFRGVYGNDLFDYTRLAYGSTKRLPGANVLKEAVTSGLSANPEISSYYVEKGSFLRLDNASIAYNFNTKSLWGIERFRVYFTGQNLFVITKYKGLDPEVDMSGLAPGVEGNEYYPKSRTFSVGINLVF